MNDIITAENVSYAYGADHTVLNELSVGIKKAECFIIIGPNGSGKTTLMKILAGLISPDHGDVRIMGRQLKAYSRKILAQHVAYVPQQVTADFPYIVYNTVLFGRSPHLGIFGLESKEDRRKCEQAMAFTEVDHLAGRRLDQLSGGERQRVFIARAICQEPRIILLDEPTAALDIAHQLRVMDLMEKMKQEKQITVVMVSHDINLAALYADSLMLVSQGRMVACGPPDAVLTYDTLETTYGCRLLVDESPLGSIPRVTPVPGRYINIQAD